MSSKLLRTIKAVYDSAADLISSSPDANNNIIYRRYISPCDSRVTIDNFERFLASICDAIAADKKYSTIEAIELRNLFISKIPKKIQKKLNKNTDQNYSEACKIFVRFMTTQAMPGLVDLIKKPEEDYESALKRLRHLHNQYLSKKGMPTLLNIFKYHESEKVDYFSVQEPIGRLTTEQLTKLQLDPITTTRSYFHNCYIRNMEGLSAFRKQTFGVINEDKIEERIAFYRHTSSIPIDIKDFRQRIETTERNFRQLAYVLGTENLSAEEASNQTTLSVPITEIRLLSVLNKNLSALDTSQHQYQQVLETYFAMLRCDNKEFNDTVTTIDTAATTKVKIKPDLMLFAFGTNAVRQDILSDDLQTWINTRSFNLLYEKVFERFRASSDFYKKRLEEIHKQRAALAEAVQHIKLQNSSQAIENFRDILEAHHKNEAELLTLHKKQWEKSATLIQNTAKDKYAIKIFNDFNTAQNLFFSKAYENKNHNYELQAVLVRLNYELKRKPVTGCNDAKDRDSRLANTIESHEIFNQIHQFYPSPYQEHSHEKLNHIQSITYRSSTTRFGAEAVSAPGATDCQLDPNDGNAHLKCKPYLAKLPKDVFKAPIKITVQDSLVRKKASSNWFKAAFFGAMFFLFSAAFGVMNPVDATGMNQARSGTSPFLMHVKHEENKLENGEIKSHQNEKQNKRRDDEGMISPKKLSREKRRENNEGKSSDPLAITEDNKLSRAKSATLYKLSGRQRLFNLPNFNERTPIRFNVSGSSDYANSPESDEHFENSHKPPSSNRMNIASILALDYDLIILNYLI